MKSFIVILICLLTLFSCVDKKKSSLVKDKPNILWITCEDITPMLGTYGDPVATTPTLDQLAERGIQFNQAYSTAPVCAPARSCLVTGIYATSMGTQNLRSDFDIPEDIRTLPHLLREQGYYCTNNYKEDYNFIDTTIWDESSRTAHWKNRPPGSPFFSVFNFETTHQSQIFGDDETFYQKYGKQLEENQRHRPENIILPPYYFDSPEVRKLWARYYDLVTIMDGEVAEILDELEKDGLSENTIVFFFSDHGTGMPRAKRALYNSGVQVPFIIYIPEKYRNITDYNPGTQVDEIVSFVDFPPTLLSIAGIDQPEYMQGQPFLGRVKTSNRKYAISTSDRVDEAFEISRSVKSSRYSYIRNFLPHMPLIQPNFYTDQSEIMQELYRLKDITDMTAAQQSMWHPRRTPEELYDLNMDPYETKNLVGDPAYENILMEMRTELKEWMITTHDTGLMPEAYMKAHTQNSTAYHLAEDPEKFPIKEILGLNDLILEEPIDQDQLAGYLKDPHELMRYWAAVWLQHVSDPGERTVARLNEALNDPSVYVRLAVADVLCSYDQCNEQAQKTILNGLRSDQPMVLLMAARIFELNKEKARDIENEVMKIKENLDISTEGKWKGYDLYANWALKEAFKKE